MKRWMLFVAAITLFAQSTPPPAFEVTSVKPTAGEFPGRFQFLHGRFHTTNTWVKYLIERAYSLKDYQVSGGPGWVTTERFDIDAKAENPDATEAQMRVMLQTLLADRFRLKLREEAREFQVYALVTGKNGPKIKPLKEGEGGNCGAGWGPNGYFGCKITMTEMAGHFEGQLRHPILDHTGLDGRYDVKLAYDEYSANGRTPPPDYDRPSIFDAIQQELGLRLDAQKAPLKVLVIDSIERPTAN